MPRQTDSDPMSSTPTMKALIHTQYGPPEVVRLVELPIPKPQENELLVRVHSSTINRTDSGFRSAEYVISRFWSGLFRPKFPILGSEFAGVVEKVGKEVTSFREGDRVFGYNDQTFGGHAEYLTIPETAPVSTIPRHFSFDQAAALTEGAHYALVDLRAARVQSGQQVLVYGATGAIGSAAVQLLCHFGAHVTAVCNTQSLDLVRSLGAEEVVDYQTQDFTQTETRFDFIFDAVGKSSFGQCKPLLKENGIYISTELGKNGENVWLALISRIRRGKKVLFPIPGITKEDVEFLKSLAENGEFRPLIDRIYRMEEAVEAYRYVEKGMKTGNVILRIRD